MPPLALTFQPVSPLAKNGFCTGDGETHVPTLVFVAGQLPLLDVVGLRLVVGDALLLTEVVETLLVEVVGGTVTMIVCVTVPPLTVAGGGDWVSKQEQALLAAVLGHSTLKEVQAALLLSISPATLATFTAAPGVVTV